MVSGQRQPYVRNSRFEARRTAELLTLAAGAPVGVRPILAIMCAELTVKTQPEDVIVVGSRAVAPWLAKRKRVYSPEEVALLYGWARLSTTWEKQAATVPKPVPEQRAPTPVVGQWAPDPYGRAELRFFDGMSGPPTLRAAASRPSRRPQTPDPAVVSGHGFSHERLPNSAFTMARGGPKRFLMDSPMKANRASELRKRVRRAPSRIARNVRQSSS